MKLRETPIPRHVHMWTIWRYYGTAVFRRCETCDKVQHASMCPTIRDTPGQLRALADVYWADTAQELERRARVDGYAI